MRTPSMLTLNSTESGRRWAVRRERPEAQTPNPRRRRRFGDSRRTSRPERRHVQGACPARPGRHRDHPSLPACPGGRARTMGTRARRSGDAMSAKLEALWAVVFAEADGSDASKDAALVVLGRMGWLDRAYHEGKADAGKDRARAHAVGKLGEAVTLI